MNAYPKMMKQHARICTRPATALQNTTSPARHYRQRLSQNSDALPTPSISTPTFFNPWSDLERLPTRLEPSVTMSTPVVVGRKRERQEAYCS